MNYTDNEQKFVAVLNGKAPVERLFNALGHITAGLAAHLPQTDVEYLDYHNHADDFSAKIAKSPFIVLKANNSNQIASLRAAAKSARLPHNVFTSSMIGASAQAQIDQTLKACGDELDYWAIVLFGDAEILSPMTKKFSLFRLKENQS